MDGCFMESPWESEMKKSGATSHAARRALRDYFLVDEDELPVPLVLLPPVLLVPLLPVEPVPLLPLEPLEPSVLEPVLPLPPLIVLPEPVVPPPLIDWPLLPMPLDEPPLPVVDEPLFWPCPPLRLLRQLLNSSENFL
jgi:hypothetical protein